MAASMGIQRVWVGAHGAQRSGTKGAVQSVDGIPPTSTEPSLSSHSHGLATFPEIV